MRQMLGWAGPAKASWRSKQHSKLRGCMGRVQQQLPTQCFRYARCRLCKVPAFEIYDDADDMYISMLKIFDMMKRSVLRGDETLAMAWLRGDQAPAMLVTWPWHQWLATTPHHASDLSSKSPAGRDQPSRTQKEPRSGTAALGSRAMRIGPHGPFRP